MATYLTDIVDLFLARVKDYRLDAIYQTSGSAGLNTYVEPWLLDSVVEFDICNQALSYTPTSGSMDGYFSLDLTQENKSMLSQIMVKYWLAKEVQEVLQMQNLIQDHDFKTFSQAQNLSAKKDVYNAKIEEVSQLLTKYEYKYNDWASWKVQNY